MDFKLKIGEIIKDGKTTITILDEATFCYRVLSERSKSRGVRLISKSILEEFVGYVKTHPDCNSNQARTALCGNSINDRFEYGYESTFFILAKEAIHRSC